MVQQCNHPFQTQILFIFLLPQPQSSCLLPHGLNMAAKLIRLMSVVQENQVCPLIPRERQNFPESHTQYTSAFVLLASIGSHGCWEAWISGCLPSVHFFLFLINRTWTFFKVAIRPLKKYTSSGTSLVVQWLRLLTPHAGGPGSIPGQETRSHMPQLRVHMPQLRPSAAK